MSDDLGPFDAVEVRAAEALDREVDSVLAGRSGPGTDPALLWLANAARPPAPGTLLTGVRRTVRAAADRAWRSVRVAAAALGALLAAHGLGNILNGAWVARGLGEDHSPHASLEGGLALLAVAAALAVGVLRPQRLGPGLAGAVPLGLVLGIQGVRELGTFGYGAALHLTEAALAVAAAVLWWRTRRDARALTNEQEV